MKAHRGVGPVLSTEYPMEAVVAALRELNPTLEIVDRGAYVRAFAVGRCQLKGDVVARILGRPFAIPSDLEAIMPSFQGAMSIAGDVVTWDAGEKP